MNKLTFDNDWMELVVRHGGQLLTVTDAIFDKNRVTGGSSVVGTLFGRHLVADVNNWVPPAPAKGDGFFIKSDNKLFEIGMVDDDVDEMNGFLTRNREFSVIATDNRNHIFAVTSKPVGM
jgi:hypothetical protein